LFIAEDLAPTSGEIRHVWLLGFGPERNQLGNQPVAFADFNLFALASSSEK
jgi:hypothetical protein